MPLVELDGGPMPCPLSVAVIGGGRWARVLLDVLCGLVPPSVALSAHSRHNANAMKAWAEARGRGRIQVSKDWPPTASGRPGGVIVANAARDHEDAVAWALSAGIPVLVEKPIALTVAGAQRLADLAHDRNVRFAAAHVFLFARYLENFAKVVESAGPVESLHLDWADPQSEARYGEPKRYDAGLPVLADWLPHVVPIAGVLLPALPGTCRGVRVRRGGAVIEVDLVAGNVPCTVRMERNAERRRRTLSVSVGGEIVQLDHTTEPGTIVRGVSTVSGDREWEAGPRPTARMLTAFLAWAAGGERDGRLDIGPALQACRIIDQARDMYRSAQLPWLRDRLARRGTVDEDLRYALAEFLQADGPLSVAELERRTEELVRNGAGALKP